MKTIVYNGNSKIIKRIVSLLNGKAPLPTSDTWGTNGQVLTTDGNGATSWTNASGGSDVSFSQTLTSGTESGTITINGTGTKIYAPTQPTKLSDLSNDEGFIDNTVNNLTNYYLKSQTYTQTEINNLISAINQFNIEFVQTLPTTDIDTHTLYFLAKTTAETNNYYDEYINTDGTTVGWEKVGSTSVDLSQYYTKTQTDNLLANKVDKVTGKGLSTEDFTSALKTKLDGIETGAEVNVQADWDETDTTSDAYIQNKPTLATVATSGSYNDLSDTPTIPTVNDGTITFMQGNTNLGSFSANQSSNATITIPTSSIDINNETPTFTEASTRANIASGETISTLFGKIKKFFADLASVAFSGSYNDLSDKPTIPTVNNATLTIQKNGTTVNSFTANASSNVTANITVPTNNNELTNGAGYITSSGTCAVAKSIVGTDTRNVNDAPSTYMAKQTPAGIVTEFKNRSTIGAPGSSTFGTLITITPWHDSTGGKPVQLYFDDTGTRATREASSDSSWGNWLTLIDSGNIGSISAVSEKATIIYENDILVTSRTTWQSYSKNCGKTIKSVMVCPSGRNQNGSFQYYATFSGTTWTVYYRNPVDYSGDGFTVWIYTQ